MLSAMRSIFVNDTRRTATRITPELLDLLGVGAVLGFGLLPLQGLSGKRYRVGDVNTYVFDKHAYTSFVLRHDQPYLMSLIVAEAEGERYLAISRTIPRDEWPTLFPDQDIDLIFDEPLIKQLKVGELATYKGWVSGPYRRALDGVSGLRYHGDYRPQAALKDIAPPRGFTYCLFVNEHQQHAIEMEKYEDGRIELYATVYRPLSDVAQLVPPLKPVANDAAKHKDSFSKYDTTEAQLAEKMAATLRQRVGEQGQRLGDSAQKTKDAARPTATYSEPVNAKSAKPAPVLSATQAASANAGNVLPMAPASVGSNANPIVKTPDAQVLAPSHAPALYTPMPPDLMGCDIEVAERLINEAMRNQLSIAQVIRKIIDLPTITREQIFISLPLSDDEWATLARRYKLPAEDKPAIQARVLEELRIFAGAKKHRAEV